MKLSVSQLALLVEMTEVEIAHMKKIIDSDQSSVQESDAASEHSLQLLSLASTLKELYREQFSAGAGEMSYDELISDIHERRL